MSVTAKFFDWPDRWQTRPLFSTGAEVSRRNVGMREENLLSLSYGRVVSRDIESADGLLPDSFETYQIVEPGDEVFRFTDLQNDQRSLRSGLVTERGIITSAYLVFRPNRKCFEPRFFDYLMRAFDNGKVFYSLGGGVRQSLKFADVRRLSVPMPPLDEQKAIANYLDRELAGLATLESDLAHFRRLLLELRAARIFDYCTQGVSGAQVMKTTSTDLFSNAPTYWQPSRLKDVVAGKVNGTWGDEPAGGADDVWCVRIADFDRQRLAVRTPPHTVRRIRVSELKSRALRNPSLLIERSGGGDLAPVGAVVLYDHDDVAVCSNFITRLDLHPGQSARFWAYLHQALYSTGITRRSIKQSTGIQNLDLQMYLSESCAVPPLDEQEQIAASLDDFSVEVFKLLSLIERLTELNQQRRRSLVSAAVTGKIDVRGESRG